MIQTLRLFGCVRQNPFALIRKRQVNRGRNLLTNSGSAFNLLPDAFDRGMISQETISQILIFADQSQQQVLGLDCGTTELAGFVTSEENDPAGSFSVSFEHKFLILSVPDYAAH